MSITQVFDGLVLAGESLADTTRIDFVCVWRYDGKPLGNFRALFDRPDHISPVASRGLRVGRIALKRLMIL